MGKYDFLKEKSEEVADRLKGYSPENDPILKTRWQGTYILRALDMEGPDDLLLPSFGFHWNLLPDDDNGNKTAVPCLQPLYEKCFICDTLAAAVKHKRIEKEIVYGGKNNKQDKMSAKSYAYLRALLVDFKDFRPSPGVKEPPKFKDLPAYKIVQLPKFAAQQLNAYLRSSGENEWGPEQIFDYDKGHLITLKVGDHVDFYYKLEMSPKNYKVPKEFRDREAMNGILDIKRLVDELYRITPESVQEQLEERQSDLPDFFIEELGSGIIDVPVLNGGSGTGVTKLLKQYEDGEAGEIGK